MVLVSLEAFRRKIDTDFVSGWACHFQVLKMANSAINLITCDNGLWQRFCITIWMVSVAILGISCRFVYQYVLLFASVAVSHPIFIVFCTRWNLESFFSSVFYASFTIGVHLHSQVSYFRNFTLILSHWLRTSQLLLCNYWKTNYLVKARAWVAYCFSANKRVSRISGTCPISSRFKTFANT